MEIPLTETLAFCNEVFFPIQRYQINKTEARITLITNFILKILQFAVNTKMILKTNYSLVAYQAHWLQNEILKSYILRH